MCTLFLLYVVTSFSPTANVQILTISKTSVTALPVVDKCLDCNYAVCVCVALHRTCNNVQHVSLLKTLCSSYTYRCVCFFSLFHFHYFISPTLHSMSLYLVCMFSSYICHTELGRKRDDFFSLCYPLFSTLFQ